LGCLRAAAGALSAYTHSTQKSPDSMNGTATTHPPDTLRVWVLYEDATTFVRALEFTDALEGELDEGWTMEPGFHLIGTGDSFVGRLRLQALMGTVDLLVVAVHAGEALPEELAPLRDAVWFPREHAPLGLVGLVGSASCDHGRFSPQHHRLRDLAQQWGVAYLPEGMAGSPLASAAPDGQCPAGGSAGWGPLPATGPARRDWGIND
jgi:hypothetical protein